MKEYATWQGAGRTRGVAGVRHLQEVRDTINDEEHEIRMLLVEKRVQVAKCKSPGVVRA